MAVSRKKRSPYEGLQHGVKTMRTPAIEVWQNQYPSNEYTVTIDFPEFTCLCPKTGLPDFATITIRYMPNRWCLELKSLKLYFVWYRQVGIFNEHAVNRILEDIVAACGPRWAEVTAEFNARGGMGTVVRREYQRSKRPS